MRLMPKYRETRRKKEKIIAVMGPFESWLWHHPLSFLKFSKGQKACRAPSGANCGISAKGFRFLLKCICTYLHSEYKDALTQRKGIEGGRNSEREYAFQWVL